MADNVFPAPRSAQDLCDALAAAPEADRRARDAAAARNAALTKPAGALGRLEDLAIWYCGWAGSARPPQPRAQIIVFAGNHGVSASGVSAYPPEVTAQMVANFEAGGAAINQLAERGSADLLVVPLDLDRPTADFTQVAALGEEEMFDAIAAGWNAVDPAAGLLALGEMGIGNTTAAAALSAALFGGDAADWAGPGAGVVGQGMARKRAVIDAGLAQHRETMAEGGPLAALRCLGGREIAALVGALLAARRLGAPVLLDGFVVCAAAAVLERIGGASALAHCQAAHRSAEPGHQRQLERLGLTPLLDLGLRLGEGSGAALAISLLRAAIACQSGMASFDEAQVSGKA
ncbi:MAG: nicotinate-nucleotide--dimethylbenzimidazole phosphoribosyltransferase [Pseudomonadota bacterium]